MKNIRFFLSDNFPFLIVKFSIYLNRRVYVMLTICKSGEPVYVFLASDLDLHRLPITISGVFKAKISQRNS